MLIAALIVALLIAYKLIDDKTIEDQALAAIQDSIQRKVTIDGEFKLTRSLHPTLKTSAIRIASADWDTQAHLIEAERFEIGIDLLDLLRGVITIENVVFDNAKINIRRNQEGQSNLDFATTKKSSKKQTVVSFLDVTNIKINNLQLDYVDEQAEQKFVYKMDSFSLHPKNKRIIQVQTSSSVNNQPLEVTASMCRIRTLLSATDCAIIAQVNTKPFATRIEGKANISTFENRNKLRIKIAGGDINDFALIENTLMPTTQSIEAAFLLHGPMDALQISELEGTVELIDTRIELNGDVSMLTPLQGANISIDVSGSKPNWLDAYQQVFPGKIIDSFSIRAKLHNDQDIWKVSDFDSTIEIDKSKLIAQGEIIIESSMPMVALNTQIEGVHPEWLNLLQDKVAAEKIDKFSINTNISSQDNTWSLENFDSTLVVDSNTLSASGNIHFHPEHGPNANLNVNALGNSLRTFEQMFKQPLPESEQFSINSILNYQNSTLTISELDIVIDNTQVEGMSAIEFTSPPNIRANLHADSVNAEHIIKLLSSGTSEAAHTSDKEQAKAMFSNQPIALDWLNYANTDISLEIEKLMYKQATLTKIQADVSAKNNQASFDLSSLRYQDANLLTNAKLDGDKQHYTYKLYTEAFDIGRLLEEIGVSTTLQGKIDASIDLATFGNTSKQLATNSMGKITAVMTEGALADAPIDLLATNLLVELMPGRSKKDQTKIECLFVQLAGTDGVFKSDAAMLNTENIVMTADGSVDLSEETLNFALIPKPKNIELFTLDTNIRVKGPITEPAFSLDKGSLFKKILKSAASVALGPAATLAIPFANMGTDRQAKCFSEVANTTSRAIAAQEEAARKAKEEAEAAAAEETDTIKEATVEPLEP